MGQVWLARDEVLHRDVAVKEVLPPGWANAEERDALRTRTMREARTTARLNHPNVIQVYDVVLAGANPWIVMEYVPSRSMQQIIVEDGPMPPARAARIGLAVLAALRAAHRAGVLHRDVKPHNVLIADDGRVVLTDFGLAIADGDGRMTRPGLVMGSPQYVSPERAAEGVSTVAADLWSLGATLYAAVEGRSPYARRTSMATLTALATSPPDPARHAGALRPVLDGLLRRDPRRRIGADEVERLLRRVPAETPRPAGTATPGPGPGSAGGDRPAPPARERDAGDSAAAGSRRRRSGSLTTRGGRTWVVATAAGVAVLAVLVTVALLRAGAGDKPDPGALPAGTAGTATPTATATGNGSAAGAAFPCGGAVPAGAVPVSPAPRPSGEPFALTAGWTWHVDPAGFRIAVPVGWLGYPDGTASCFREPEGSRTLSVDSGAPPTESPDRYLAAQERRITDAGALPGYQRLVIQRIDSYDGAEWECRWTSAKGVALHSYRMLANAGGRAYTIGWVTREFDWSVNKANLLMLRQSFHPADDAAR
ncbi:hypothetical protein CIK06_19155 [Plantactinospora sp. KBS50]|nr:hypothetical protein CIK06_19155 [Plantactinospora sp. KBS50]